MHSVVLLLLLLCFLVVISAATPVHHASGEVDISGLDKVEVLRALWERQFVAAFFYNNLAVPIPRFDASEARRAIKEGYIDYFCGRCMKFDMSQNTLDSTRYDHVAGQGTMAMVITELRGNACFPILLALGLCP